MDKKIARHLNHLKLFDNQRRSWLALSAFVVLSVGSIIWNWYKFDQSNLIWIPIVLGLTVSVVWWYWTMRLIKDLIQQRREESEILVDIISHIRLVQNEVRKLHQRELDKHK